MEQRAWNGHRLILVVLMLAVGAGVVVAAEDGPAAPEAGTVIEQAVVGDPPATAAVDGPIPPLVVNPFATPPCGVTGFIPEAAINQTGALFAHEARFTWGFDLPKGPCFTTNDEPSWKKLSDPSFLPHTASSAFPGYVGGILKEAHAHQDEIDTTADPLGLFKDFFDLAGIPSTGSTSKDFLGYTPLRARWLRSRWSGQKGKLLFKPEKKYVYQDFSGFEDIRLRGARLYCAARRAQREQDPNTAPSLGERVAYTFNILGQQIDFLVLRSTVMLNGPQRCTGGSADAPSCPGAGDGAAPSDGAQAFEIPFQLGTRLIPIRGLPLPDLDEVRVPMVLVTGDSEVKTLAEKRAVWVGYIGHFDPLFVDMHSKEYQTVTHVDALLSAGTSDHVGPVRVPLFTLGVASVFLKLDLDYGVGAFQPLHDRVIDPKGALAAWPPLRRPDTVPVFVNPASGVRYHDGPWRLDVRGPGFRGGPGGSGSPSTFWSVLPDVPADPFWTHAFGPHVRPHDVRAVTDDDHAVSSRAHASLTGTIAGELGGSFGPFTAKLVVSGGVGVTVNQDHIVRDALMAQDPLLPAEHMRPITALTVRTRGESTLDFTGLDAKIRFTLSLPIVDDIDFDKKLFHVKGASVLLASDEPPDADDEQLMLRLGTGSRDGSPMTQPAVRSHLPQEAEFAPDTFDVDVAACLADTTPNPPTPPPCKASVGPGQAPHANICLYGPTGFLAEEFGLAPPPTVCGNVPGYVAGLAVTPDQKACVGSYLGFLCAPISQWQSFEGSNVVGRLWDFDEPMGHELYDIVSQCVTAFDGVSAQQVAESLISAAACTSEAALLGDTDIMNVVNPGAPEAKVGPACGW
jgi:hypothetical protein